MSEKEPCIEVETQSGYALELRRHNASLYTFWGQQAIDGVEQDIEHFSHVFVRVELGVDPTTGDKSELPYPIWKGATGYEDIVKFMRENRYECHENMQEVSQYDQSMFREWFDLDKLGLLFPSEWDQPLDAKGEN